MKSPSGRGDEFSLFFSLVINLFWLFNEIPREGGLRQLFLLEVYFLSQIKKVSERVFPSTRESGMGWGVGEDTREG